MRVGKLLDLVNRYYELQLCYAELEALGARDITLDIMDGTMLFDVDDPSTLLFRSSWLCDIDGEKTFIGEIIDASRKIIWRYSDLWCAHLAYPFKARMRPQVARSLINIVCPKKEGIILDPFCGSGTTNVEAYLCGLDSVGMDIIPFYTFMSEAKIRFYEEEIDFGLGKMGKHPILKVVHAACTLLRTKFKYEKRVEELKVLQEIYFRFKDKVPKTKHEFRVASATEIPYPSGYFDGIVCSPPYGSAIQYEKENPGPKEMMEIPSDLKPYVVLTKDEQSWKSLMLLALEEMKRVLKPHGRLAIVIGNQKRAGEIVDYVGWTKKQLLSMGFELLYQLTELISSTGTRNILNDEIMVFEKTDRKS